MIRLRHQDGSITEVSSSKAVEYVDQDGKLAAVITQNAGGTVHFLTPGDPLFNAYCNSTGMRQSNVTVHEPFEGRPVT